MANAVLYLGAHSDVYAHLKLGFDSELLLPGSHVFTASKLLQTTLNLPKQWWVDFGMKQSVCDEISNQIMDLYDES